MNLFTPLYELIEELFGLYDERFGYIFDTIYEAGSYDKIGSIFVLIPLVGMALFYFIYKNPYATILHWIIAILIGSVFVIGLTINQMRLTLADYVVDPDYEVQDFTNNLIIMYCVINAFLSLVTGFLWSLALKQKSKIQMHLPF